LLHSPWAVFIPRLRLRGEEQVCPHGVHAHGGRDTVDNYC
jgi:hypothetical protein